MDHSVRAALLKDLSMTKLTASIAAVALLGVGVTAQTRTTHPGARAAGPAAAAAQPGMLSADQENEIVSGTCSTCHDDEVKPGGLLFF